MFLAIFRIILCVFLISHVFHCFSQFSTSYSFHDFQFSRHTPDHRVYISLFLQFYCFSPYSRPNSVCLIFQFFSLFSPYSWSYSVHFLFPTFLHTFSRPARKNAANRNLLRQKLYCLHIFRSQRAREQESKKEKKYKREKKNGNTPSLLRRIILRLGRITP